MFPVNRRFRRIFMLVLAAAALLLPAVAAQAASQSSNMVVMIDVEGNKLVPKEEILSAVKATMIGSPLDMDAIRTDGQSIFDLGYFSQIDPPDFLKVLGGIKVVFHVVEYPPLKEIDLQGLTKMPKDKALAFFKTKPGEVINRLNLAKDLRSVMEAANKEYGLILSSRNVTITPDGVVEIDLAEMRLRNLSFVGLKKTKEEVVRREISLKEGEIIDNKALVKDLQRIFMLGYFESIEPKLMPTDDPELLDMAIEFKERKTATIGAKLQYSPDNGELLGGFKINDTNLFGSGNTLGFDVNFNANKLNFELAFKDPWLTPQHTSLNLRLYDNNTMGLVGMDPNNHSLYYPASEHSRGLDAGLGWPLGDDLTFSVNGKHNVLNLAQVGTDEWTGAPPANAPLLTYGDVTTNSLMLQLDYVNLTPQDAKNVYVANGAKFRLSSEFAGGLLGGDTLFQRYQMDTALFLGISPRDVLGLRLVGGYVNIVDDPLETSLFKYGGSENLRGYGFRAFTGDEAYLGTLEFRHRFTDAFEGVAFVDAGSISTDSGWEQPMDYGLGFRVYLPVLGQLRFDWAWQNSNTPAHFNFSIGEVF